MKRVLVLVLLTTGFLLSNFVETSAIEMCDGSPCVYTPTGLLTVFSDGSGDFDDGNSGLSYLYGTHSFISFKNTADINIQIGNYTVSPSEEITIGTFDNRIEHEGIWYNLESYFISNTTDAYESRVSITTTIGSSAISDLDDYIDNYDEDWAYTRNCAHFAEGAWNEATSSIYTVNGRYGTIYWFDTPLGLRNSINTYVEETGRSVQDNSNIGYHGTNDVVDSTIYN